MDDINIYDLLVAAADKYGNKTAIFDDNQNIKVDFSTLKSNTFRLANALMKLGLKKGDKLGVYLPNCSEYFYSYLSSYITGIIIVPMDFFLQKNELINIINHCDIKVIITTTTSRASLDEIKNKTKSLENIITIEDSPYYISFWKLINSSDNFFKKAAIDKRSYSTIFYTSGSTGAPKGVVWNHKHIYMGASASKYFLDISEKDRVITAIPMSHSGGMLFPMLAIKEGISTAIMRRFSPLDFVQLIEKRNVTLFWIVPSMFYAIIELKNINSFNLDSIKYAAVFGAQFSTQIISKFRHFFPNGHILNGWGMTEVIPPTTVGSTTNLDSVGKPYKNITLEIIDQKGALLKADKMGEIVAKGTGIFVEYYNEPELTNEAMLNGWFKTGDLGKKDELGNLYILGRTKDMIKVGGKLVWSSEVEKCLMSHPCTKEAAAIGVDDKLRGEVVKAFVVLKPGIILPEKYLREYCKNMLARFKIPRYITYLAKLPRTGTGKTDKTKLKSLN